MPIYECSEYQFIENLRKLLDTHFKIIVKKSIKIKADTKHNISRLPDYEFEKYSLLLRRSKLRSNIYAKKPFFDQMRKRFYDEDDKVHSARYSNAITLSVPYYKVEYSFDIWGETYSYIFDVLFQPEIKLETKNIKSISLNSKHKMKTVLIHVLSFKPPRQETIQIELPKSVLLFDINQKIRS